MRAGFNDLSIGLQAGFDIGNGLVGVSENDTVHAEFARGFYAGGYVIEKDYFGGVHTKALTRKREDLPVGLLDPFLMRVDDEITEVLEPVKLLLFAPSAREAIAEYGGPITRAQTRKVFYKLYVELAQVFLPEVTHEGGQLRLVQPQDLTDVSLDILLGHLARAAILPDLHQPLIEFPRPRVRAGLPTVIPSPSWA